MNTRPRLDRGRDRGHERGQILVLFALGAVAMIAMVGLVLDGSATFAQRRDQQNGADLAAIAGANAYMNTNGSANARSNAARAAAAAVASSNGYVDGAGSTTIATTVTLLQSGAEVKVDIGRPHANNFARIIPGQDRWQVTVTASAVAGLVDTGVGAGPWIMNINAFNPDGTPKYTSSNPQSFGEANGDYPISALDLAWTDYNGSNNVNTAEVHDIIVGANVVTATLGFEQYIGQHNQGNHTALYGDVDQYLAGRDLPIPIVGPGSPGCAAPQQAYQDGCFKGWAIFHVISASGGSDKTITGYFKSDFVAQPLTVGECTTPPCGEIDTSSPFSNYVVRLSD